MAWYWMVSGSALWLVVMYAWPYFMVDHYVQIAHDSSACGYSMFWWGILPIRISKGLVMVALGYLFLFLTWPIILAVIDPLQIAWYFWIPLAIEAGWVFVNNPLEVRIWRAEELAYNYIKEPVHEIINLGLVRGFLPFKLFLDAVEASFI